MSGWYWYADNPNCGRCGHLNSQGYCSMTACIYPVSPKTIVIKSPKPQTNYDRTIEKTPKELAELFNQIETCGRNGYLLGKNGWLKWLKQEIVE